MEAAPMAQGQLFDADPAGPGAYGRRRLPLPPIAADADPGTSHEAADELDGSGARARQMAEVLKALRRHPGSTSRELGEASGLDRYLCARRLPDLRAAGLARQGPARACRVGGRAAVTWEATATGEGA
jgi:hypothetical protein